MIKIKMTAVIACMSKYQYVSATVNRILTVQPYSSAVNAVVMCMCVCVHVTCWYCVKIPKSNISQTTPHDSPEILVFCRQKSWRNLNGVNANFWQITCFNMKVVQDNMRIFCWSRMGSCICSTELLWLKLKSSNLVYWLVMWRISLGMTRCPQVGVIHGHVICLNFGK